MELKYSDAEFKEKGKDNPEQSEKEKKGRLKKFCSKLWDNTKRTTQVLAIAVGMTVIAHGCSLSSMGTFKFDADDGEVEIDSETDNNEIDGIEDPIDVPEIDVPDVEIIEEDAGPDGEDVVEITCAPPGTPLEGDVDPLIANTNTDEATFDGSDSSVSGNLITIVGGEVSGDILILGECPDDPNAIAAFGAQDGSVNVVPQYRLDFGTSTFVAELPSLDSDVCPPLEVDTVPVSMYNEDTNLAIKNANIGTIVTRAEFGFTSTLIPEIFANGSESTSPIALDGSGYEVKVMMVSLESLLLNMSASVYSNIGEKILESEVQNSGGLTDSKTLRVSQLGSGDSMLPGVEWSNPSGRICMRSCTDANEVTHEDKTIDAIVTPLIIDACGRIFDGFDIESATVYIDPLMGFQPPHLAPLYSFAITAVSGLDSMAEGNPTITPTITRDPSRGLDTGEHIIIRMNISGELVSRDVNPKTGETDRTSFEIEITLEDPDANFEYETQCGCKPAGF